MSSPRTDEERAKAHFGLTDDEWTALSPEQKQSRIDALPDRGSYEPKGEPMGQYKDWDTCIKAAQDDPDIDDPEAYCGYIKARTEEIQAREKAQTAFDKLPQLLKVAKLDKTKRTIINLESFGWMPQDRLFMPEGMSGQLYKVVAITQGKTHHKKMNEDGSIEEFDRVFNHHEIDRLAGGFTFIENLNYDHLYADPMKQRPLEPIRGNIVDSEEEDNQLELLIYIDDDQFHKRYDDTQKNTSNTVHLKGVSIEYTWRDERLLDGWAQVGCIPYGIAFITDRFGDDWKPACPNTSIGMNLGTITRVPKDQIRTLSHMIVTDSVIKMDKPNIATSQDFEALGFEPDVATRLFEAYNENATKPTIEERLEAIEELASKSIKFRQDIERFVPVLMASIVALAATNPEVALLAEGLDLPDAVKARLPKKQADTEPKGLVKTEVEFGQAAEFKNVPDEVKQRWIAEEEEASKNIGF